MSIYEDEYAEAVKGSTLHAYDDVEEEVQSNGKSIFIKLMMFSTLGFVGYTAFNTMVQEQPTVINRVYATNVMGVSKVNDVKSPTLELAMTEEKSIKKSSPTVEKSVVESSVDDEEENFMAILENSEVDSVVEKKAKKSIDIRMALADIVESVDEKKESKVEAYSKNIDKNINRESNRKIKKDILHHVVQEGDTLVGLAKAYYGNEGEYSKIINANDALTPYDDRIYVGQVINLPYQ